MQRAAREGPFYATEIHEITPAGRELLESYSEVEPAQVLQHVRQLRDQGWDFAPYGCVGLGGFANPSIQQHVRYDEVMERLKQGGMLLDVGCGYGQNVRKLVHDGAPSTNVFGTDLSGHLVECGFDYFLDRDRLGSNFLVCDMLNPESEIRKFSVGKFDVIFASYFFHVWGWDKQLEVMRGVAMLLKPSAGSLLIGFQVGAPGRPRELDEKYGEVGRLSRFQQFQHDEESFRAMWDEIERSTGTKWSVQAFRDFPSHLKPIDEEGLPGGCRITFTVRRL